LNRLNKDISSMATAKKIVIGTNMTATPPAQSPVGNPAPTKNAVTKPTVKSPVHSPVNSPVKAAAKAPTPKKATAKKPTPKPAANKTVKPKKPKLVRDSFTIPKAEYGVLEELKQRAAQLAHPIKKSELIRAGIKVLASLSGAALLTALNQVPTIKTGRPAGKK
jgi:hypothetical protein